MRRRERARRLDGDLVVAVHEHVGAEHEESLHQVVGEGIVVVDQEEPRRRAPGGELMSPGP